MEFKQENIWRVSGFKEPQDLGVDFRSGPVEQPMADGSTRDYFSLNMEGDIVVDDGWLHYGGYEVQLNVERARELHRELSDWLMAQIKGLGIYTIQFRDVLIDDGSSEVV